MRIIFAGTPEFAAHTLKALLNTEHEICAVYTQPDRPAGRGRKLTASPVKQIALENNIAIEQPENFKQSADCEKLDSYQADLMIVVAYGLLLPQTVLDTPKMGCINIHASLLPRWRGAAPIQRAIYAGDAETGICIMQMEAGLDTGPVIAKASCPITDDDTTQHIHDRLATLGAQTLIASLPKLAELQLTAQVQNDDGTCYAEKITKSEAIIDWQQNARQISRQIRAFNPWPIAQTVWQDTVLRIWEAKVEVIEHQAKSGEVIAITRDVITVAAGKGAISITKLQTPGKRAMSVADFLNAHKLVVGDGLG